jgi:succinyl-CoA synthetase alpha subunit
VECALAAGDALADDLRVLVDENTRVLVCGMTGREGGFHTQQMIDYGTKVVAGVTPGKGGTEHFGVPVQDSLKMVNRLHTNGKTRLLGGNCAGIISPGKCKMGIMPGHIFAEGPIGLVSRSGTLTYEIVYELTNAGLGQTTCVGIGGDPLPGTRFIEVMEMFENDPETTAVVIIGEIGGSDEETAAEYIKTMSKPTVGFISGRTAPPGKRMGHAGAIISGKSGTPQSKVDAFLAAGVLLADRTSDVPGLVKQALQKVGASV